MKTSGVLTHWGPFVVETEGDVVTAVCPHPADPDPSPIGRSLRQVRECRVARPSVRRSWLDDGPGARTELRGKEPFVEVEWGEALSLVTDELTRVRQAHGNAAIFGGSYGWSSAGRFHLSSNQIRRFLRLLGGSTETWGTYSSSAAAGIIPHVLGMTYLEAVAEMTSWSVIAEHCELFVSFGGLRLTNTQVSYGGQGPHHTRDWMARAKARGVGFVNVGPLRDDFAPELESRWIHPVPGTDVALMAALIHTLVVEGRHDPSFLATHCHGWRALEAYVLGTRDGVPKSAAWAASITGLASEAIEALAREMAAKRCFLNLTLALQRQDHGEQSYWMGIALAAVLGQIGLPGGGVAFTFGASGNVGAGPAPARVPSFPVPKQAPDTPVISVSRVTELLESRGESFSLNGRDEPFPDTRLVYWCGGNVFHHHQDLGRLERAWRRPDTIVVHEPFWTPMAKRADIVLPATTPLERGDLGVGGTLLVAMQPVLEPYGEARDDYWIFCELSERLGVGEEFSQGRSADAWVSEMYEEFRRNHPSAPSYDAFRSEGSLALDSATMGERAQVFLGAFRSDPARHPLGTPSGRIELHSETIAGFAYDDCPAHPTWLEPFERLGRGEGAHPLHLVSNQPAGRLHGQYDHGEVSRATKIAGREPCRIHPDDAAQRSIRDGDVVRVFNERGACLAGAALSDAVMPGVVQLSTGSWYDPDRRGMCKHGNPNVLTRDKGTSRLAQGPSAHTCLVEVARYEGDPPPVTAFDPPVFCERPR